MILDTLKSLDETHHEAIERWFALRRAEAAPFIYTSVDLRHSGTRLAPVDTNLYPAGFNNMSPQGRLRAARFFARYIAEHHPHTRHAVIVPENHTRNLSYLDNLATLSSLLSSAGLEVRIGNLIAPPGEPLVLTGASGETVRQYPMVKKGDMLALEDGFIPDLILLNNDMTAGIPPLLQDVSQPIAPPPDMGWWRRRKSVHFAAYATLAREFAAEFSLDPWLLSADFHACGKVDFKQEQGLDCVAKAIDRMIARARENHARYGIAADPYVFIKADSGTYGMGIMTARSGDELLSINKKTRNKMHVIKEGSQITEVIIQEGIPTIDTVDGKPAEPMMYLVDGIPAGGMYRANGQRDATGNLNAAGMEFTGMCDDREDECGQWKTVQGCHFRAFGLVATLAALAASREQYEAAPVIRAGNA